MDSNGNGKGDGKEAQQDKPRKKLIRQRYFVARELQLSIALLVITALLGGIFLQSVAEALTKHIGLDTKVLGILMLIGYIIVVAFLAMVFSHRLVGPFKRLEFEMKHVKDGDLEKRLTVRTRDDQHVRNFVEHVNDMVSDFEHMNSGYNKLNSTISTGLGRMKEELAGDDVDCDKLRKSLKSLQKEVRRHKEKW
jgi:methyl-accepting chemotaxis protein